MVFTEIPAHGLNHEIAVSPYPHMVQEHAL
jgi:hypothetical protein